LKKSTGCNAVIRCVEAFRRKRIRTKILEINSENKPRSFVVGKDIKTIISHEADILLKPNEQVTFLTENGSELDFVRKSWGYYATPSMNKRLKKFGFKTALVQNMKGCIFICVVEAVRMDLFGDYCNERKQTVLMWLDEIVCND
jgi:hypothetical protein